MLRAAHSLPGALLGLEQESTPSGNVRGVLDAAHRRKALSLDEFAAAVRDADEAAIREVVESVAPIVYRVAISMLGAGHPDVDDAVQGSLVTLIRRVGECRDHTLERFAVGIAVHTTLNVLRREKTRFRLLARFSKFREANEAPVPEGADVGLRRLLAELMADLPREQAEALLLRTVLEYSLEEVARHTGAPVNTVRSRIRLARQALVRRIAADPRLADLAARATHSLEPGGDGDE